VRDHTNIGPNNLESRARVSFYNGLLLQKVKTLNPKGGVYVSATATRRTEAFLSVRRGVCRHILEASSPERHFVVGRSSSTLVRVSTRVKKEGPSGTALVSMLRQTQGGIGVERSSSRALQTIRGRQPAQKKPFLPWLPSLIDCTTEVRLAGSGGLRKNNSESFRAVCTAWRTSREEKGSASCTMKISVKTLKGNHFDLNVQPDDTVRASLSLLLFLFLSLSLSLSVSLPTSCQA